jgi:hypothetical protein
MADLVVIEEQVRVNPKPNHDHNNSNKKQLKNPCRIHNGGHEWDDCRQNPKNNKEDGRTKPNDDRNRRGTNNNNRPREENRRTERTERQSSRERNRDRSNSRPRDNRDSNSENEYHCLHSRTDKNTKAEEKVPSSEILIAMPDKKGSKKYTTYLGLVDSGASGSLINKELVEYADFDTQLQKKPTKWDTASGVFQTDGMVLIEQYCLPQFTRKKHITTPFQMFQQRPKDKYDFILGRDLLKDLGFDIHYSTSQFVWDNISVDMVPSGYWTKSKITNVAKMWNPNRKQEELQLAKILPAEYKPVNILDVVQKQTHLLPEEQEESKTALFNFQSLFQGGRGNFKGDPITLDLLPGFKPFYGKPFSIPKAYQQVTKDEIARLESIGLLNKVTSSEWAAPTFIIPKKNSTVQT